MRWRVVGWICPLSKATIYKDIDFLKFFLGVVMATHSNVTFRTTTTMQYKDEETVNDQEEIRISERYAELSTDQLKHLLIQEQLKYATRTGDSVEGQTIHLSTKTKCYSNDIEITEF